MDPLARLARQDKWFLGGGKGAIYAPPFPRHLTAPGFWDECYLADVRLSRLFTALFLDSSGEPVRFRSCHVDWRPDRLTIVHEAHGIEVRERRCVLPCNAWVSDLEIVSGGGPLNVFLWSLQDLGPPGYGTPWQSLGSCDVTDDSMALRFDTAWPSELEPDRTAVESERLQGSAAMLAPLPVFLELGASAARQSWTVNLAQRHDDSPLYETSLLPEKFVGGRLPGDFKLFVGTEPIEGLAHLVQHYVLEPEGSLQLVCGSGLSAEGARSSFEEAREQGAVERSEGAWRAYFASVPQFESSDQFLTNAYWYRWYGLRLNTVDMPELPVCRDGSGAGVPPAQASSRAESRTFSPFVTEGIGFFRNFITYSAQAHLREVAWMHDPSLAIGILDNLGKCQRDDGSFPGHNYSCRPPRDFYHADFATGATRLAAVHGLRIEGDSLAALERYAAYLDRERGHTFENWPAEADRFGGELPPRMLLVFDQNETGQEYMSRYTAVRKDADTWAAFRVCGIDATVYWHRLLHFVTRAAESAGDLFEMARLGDTQLQVRDGLRRVAYEPQAAFFCDVLPDGTRTPARPATGLYALLADPWALSDADVAAIANRWMLNPEQFWLPAGFPATVHSDDTFSAEGEWKERRLNCPWNGRSWPMANSHLVDALANVARTVDPSLREKAGEGLMKAIRLMFHDGDPSRPNSYEHYNPVTGVPALYRGYDDYMHSWIVDLIMRHAVGVQPGLDAVDPLPLDVEWIECTDLPHPKGRMDVRIERGNEPVVTLRTAPGSSR